MTARPLAILVTGSPIASVEARAGGFARIVAEATPGWTGAWRPIDARAGELPELKELAGVIVTGSSASVTERAPWMLACEAWLRGALDSRTPVLGICFGHQLLGQALGGLVEKNPRGREIGSMPVELTADDELLDAALEPVVNMTHVDSVTRLPPGARVLARTTREPHAALRFAERVWGMQFHPEIDGATMREYLVARRHLIEGEGDDADHLLARVGNAPLGAAVLGRFARVVAEAR